MNRIENTFAVLKAKKQFGLAAFITASDPDFDTCKGVFTVANKLGVKL